MPAHPTRARGFSLLELMITLVILGVVFAGIAGSIQAVYRTQRGRSLQSQVQGEGRQGLRLLEEDLRAASLGATTGVIWADTNMWAFFSDPSPVAKRPSVQIFDNVPGMGLLPVKPGTDAILVVAAMRGADDAVPEAYVKGGPFFDSRAEVDVTEVALFQPDPVGGASPFVLVGSTSAAWGSIAKVVNPSGEGKIVLDTDANVFPDGKAEPGTRVRVASSHLYYVDTEERLVRVNLAVPRAPITAEEAVSLAILARGIENLQVDCETDGGLGVLSACPAVIGSGPTEPASFAIMDEAAAAGLASGDFTNGPRLTPRNVSSLRMLHLAVVARSEQPLLDAKGDDYVLLANESLDRLPAAPAGQFARRIYRMAVGVRNTSLGAF